MHQNLKFDSIVLRLIKEKYESWMYWAKISLEGRKGIGEGGTGNTIKLSFQHKLIILYIYIYML